MIGNSIPVENMSHLAEAFKLRGSLDEGVENFKLHVSQEAKKRIKLQILFVIPGEENETSEEQQPQNLPRLAIVRVPRGVPVAKLRLFIKTMELELLDIYGRVKRANFIMQADEHSDDWEFSFELPTYGVVYI